MRGLRFVVVAVSIVVLAGCGLTHTTAGSARTAAAGTSLQPAQQLQSATRLRADLDAVKAAATEGDLLVAVAQAQRDCQAVTGTHANSTTPSGSGC
jgi:hypothetical protein